MNASGLASITSKSQIFSSLATTIVTLTLSTTKHTHQNIKSKFTFLKILMKHSRNFLRMGRKTEGKEYQYGIKGRHTQGGLYTYITAHLYPCRHFRISRLRYINIKRIHSIYITMLYIDFHIIFVWVALPFIKSHFW